MHMALLPDRVRYLLISKIKRALNVKYSKTSLAYVYIGSL
jgi:hypothetical protein